MSNNPDMNLPVVRVIEDNYSELFDACYAVGRRLSGSEQAAEDIAAAGIFKALRGIDSFDLEKSLHNPRDDDFEMKSVRTWLCQITANQARDYLRQKAAEKVMFVAEYAPFPVEDRHPESNEEVEIIYDEVRNLRAKRRQAIEDLLGDVPYSAIADRDGVGVHAVSNRVFHARNEMASRLRKRGVVGADFN